MKYAAATFLLMLAVNTQAGQALVPVDDQGSKLTIPAVGSLHEVEAGERILGPAVTKTITASGGQITAGGVVVIVPPEAVTSALFVVRPIQNGLDPSMESVAISSDVTWIKPLIITMPINSTDQVPGGLGLALQQSDGSWHSLGPFNIDPAAGTVSASLSAQATTEKPAAQAAVAKLVNTRSELPIAVVAKHHAAYLSPPSVTVEINKSVDFLPTKAEQIVVKCADYPFVDRDSGEELPQPKGGCYQWLDSLVPLENRAPGFEREWDVDFAEYGNPILGTIRERGRIGATYTAPAKVPTPDVVTVRFISLRGDKSKEVLTGLHLEAKVKIIDPQLAEYTGNIEMHIQSENANQFLDNSTWDMHGEVTVRKDPSSTSSYPVSSSSMSGTFQKKECTTVHSDFQLESDMQLRLPDTKGEPAIYGFDFVAKASDANQMMSCVGKDGAQLTVPVSMSASSIGNHCETTEAMIESTSNPDLLEGSRTYNCPLGLATQGYTATFKWRLHRQEPTQ